MGEKREWVLVWVIAGETQYLEFVDEDQAREYLLALKYDYWIIANIKETGFANFENA